MDSPVSQAEQETDSREEPEKPSQARGWWRIIERKLSLFPRRIRGRRWRKIKKPRQSADSLAIGPPTRHLTDGTHCQDDLHEDKDQGGGAKSITTTVYFPPSNDHDNPIASPPRPNESISPLGSDDSVSPLKSDNDISPAEWDDDVSYPRSNNNFLPLIPPTDNDIASSTGTSVPPSRQTFSRTSPVIDTDRTTPLNPTSTHLSPTTTTTTSDTTSFPFPTPSARHSHTSTSTIRSPSEPNLSPVSTNSDYIETAFILKPSGQKAHLRLGLDTQCNANLMSIDTWRETGLKLQPLFDRTILPLQSPSDSGEQTRIKPKGIIHAVDWHFAGGEKTYTSDFVVVDMERFDAILGRGDIRRYRILVSGAGLLERNAVVRNPSPGFAGSGAVSV